MPRAADPTPEQPVTRAVLMDARLRQVKEQPEAILGAGDVFFEPEGERIARFDAGDDGVRSSPTSCFPRARTPS
jgi:hypothetical protein